jgi:hypothetical protein
MLAKRARDMAQVVEHLPSKSEALTSNPSTTKKVLINADSAQSLESAEYKILGHFLGLG